MTSKAVLQNAATEHPVGKLAATERGGVIIDEKAIFDAADS